MKDHLWIVDVKGEYVPPSQFPIRDKAHGEISVVRSNNTHGRGSYGWFGLDKLCIVGDCHIPNQAAWDKATQMAQVIADALNAVERRRLMR